MINSSNREQRVKALARGIRKSKHFTLDRAYQDFVLKATDAVCEPMVRFDWPFLYPIYNWLAGRIKK